MKTSKWMLLINPFDRIAGWKAFGIGIVVMALTQWIGGFGNLYFDGALDAHIMANFNWQTAICYHLIGYACLVVCFYLAARILSKGVRFQDIAGTTALARSPFLILAILFYFFAHNLSGQIAQLVITGKPALGQLFFIVAFGIACIILIIWFIALLFNAYKVSSGLKGTKLTVSFIVALLTAEIASKAIIYLTSITCI